MKSRALALLVFFGVPAGCAQVVGTDDLEPCEAETCEGGGGNAPTTSSSTSATSTGSTSASTGTAGSCFDVTMNISGNIEVKLETAQDLDFNAPSTTHCVEAGQPTFRAECADGENKGDPASVIWGDPALCAEGETCSFALQAPVVLTITPSAGANCP